MQVLTWIAKPGIGISVEIAAPKNIVGTTIATPPVKPFASVNCVWSVGVFFSSPLSPRALKKEMMMSIIS